MTKRSIRSIIVSVALALGATATPVATIATMTAGHGAPQAGHNLP
jgi:hypothetical protein